ncbi:uncharacterized protein LOC119983359 isoform X1 [Tripterygium wilfordii]|uniref:uncharacterized protein LOC119983359 isoform X1 n=1 Tax=Tripterygium wilfordii TaxID=458696 RepID=UPI0018F83A79|nr:uncharacterized protein LOC119983359 isoform X1 [Tripterygium wilfordii]
MVTPYVSITDSFSFFFGRSRILESESTIIRPCSRTRVSGRGSYIRIRSRILFCSFSLVEVGSSSPESTIVRTRVWAVVPPYVFVHGFFFTELCTTLGT